MPLDSEKLGDADGDQAGCRLVRFATADDEICSLTPADRRNSYCADGGTWVGPTTDGGAALPQHCIQTDLTHTPSPGSMISVPPGADINQYLAQAHCGDVLLLTPGQYSPIMLPAKNCDSGHWIKIQSSATDGLPGEGQRISPCAAGVQSLPGRPSYSCPNPQQLMAKISSLPAPDVTAAPGANFYRIGPGIELTRPNTSEHSAK